MGSDPTAGDTGGDIFSSLNINGLVSSGVQAFGIYEGAQTAKAAASKLTSSSLMYVILGVGALGVIALVVLKH
jgi:hypothetical protein